VTRHIVPLLGGLPSPTRERVTALVHDLVAVLAARRRLP